MHLGQIVDVHLIPQTGTIRGRIVTTEYPDVVKLTGGYLKNEWDQMGFRIVQFANFSAFKATVSARLFR